MTGLLSKVAALAAAAMAAVGPAWAGEYSGPGLSADLVMEDSALGKGKITGRFYFDRGGSRLDLNAGAKQRSLIFNSFSTHLITVSRNDRVLVDERQGRALGAQFGDEPCGGYARARFLGTESRFGRTINIWRCERPRQAVIDGGIRPGSNATVWYDTGLKHFIRKELSTGEWIELRNIRAGRQAPSRFDAPSEFKDLNSAIMLGQSEQADE